MSISRRQKKSPDAKRITISLDAETYAALEKRAKERGVSLSTVVSEGVSVSLAGGATAGDGSRIIEELAERFAKGWVEDLQPLIQGRNQSRLLADLLRELPGYLRKVRALGEHHAEWMKVRAPSTDYNEHTGMSDHDDAEMNHMHDTSPCILPAGEVENDAAEIDRLHALLIALNREKRLDGVATIQTKSTGRWETLVSWEAELRNIVGSFGRVIVTGDNGELSTEYGKPKRTPAPAKSSKARK